MRAFAVIACAGCLGPACLFPSVDGLTSGSEGGADVVDAMTDAATEGGSVPLATVDFEDGSCGDFGGGYATVSVTSTAHSGKWACMFCCNSTTSSYCTLDDGFTPALASPPPLGASYKLVAWERQGPMATSPSLGVIPYLRIYDMSGYPQESPSSAAPVSATWQSLTATLTVQVDGGKGLNVYFAADKYMTGDCIIIDDLAVYAVPDGG
jgi:hypothetical protein